MRVARATSLKYLVCAIAVGMASGFGWPDKALAQFDVNIQSRLQTYAIPFTPTVSDVLGRIDNIGACLFDPAFIELLYYHKPNQLLTLSAIRKYFPDLDPTNLDTVLNNPANRQKAADILADFFKNPDNVRKLDELGGVNSLAKDGAKILSDLSKKGITIQGVFPTSFCIKPTAQPQSSVKASFPLNPTDESNVLRNNLNNSHGYSFGFGGAGQLITSLPNFDLIALTAATQSVRYDPFSSKSFDAVTAQAAYQFFLGAYGYDSHGKLVDRINPATDKSAIPPANMITVQSVALGFQNQTVFMPTFRSETVDLFTPQVSYNLQNLSLAGKESCQAAIPDPRREGFCYYADFGLTVGQTFSDVTTQQNVNVAVGVAPGWRIPDSDLRLSLPMAATGRAYEDVPGGRHDELLQIGPALAYAPPAIYDQTGDTISALFMVSATYNRNYSTLSTADWHGYVVLGTLTMGFTPVLK